MSARIAWKTRPEGVLESHSLSFVDDRIVCGGSHEGSRRLWGFTAEGELAWTRSYKPGDHDGIYAFGSRLYLDGRHVYCLSASDGSVVSHREFPTLLTQQPPSDIGPYFWVGGSDDSFENLNGVIGLEPETLASAWEWPDADCIVRATWLRARAEGANTVFVHLPDLARCNVPASSLPAATGRQAMFAPEAGVWCAFASKTAAGVALPSGDLLWTRREDTEGRHRVLRSSATHAYAGVSDLSAYTLVDGQPQWRTPMPGRLDTWLALAGTRGFVVTDKRTVHSVNLGTGEHVGLFEAPGEVIGLAAIDDHRVAVATYDAVMSIAFG